MEKENLFSKEQLLGSESFLARRDLVDALLEEGRKYSVKETKQIIEKYMKGQVK